MSDAPEAPPAEAPAGDAPPADAPPPAEGEAVPEGEAV